METQQKTSVSKRVARGKHLGRRYCKRHGLVYTPLKNPPRPRSKLVTEYGYVFTVKVSE